MSLPSAPVQPPASPPRRRGEPDPLIERFRSALPWIIVLGAFVWSVFEINRVHNRNDSPDPSLKIIHIGHYQFEPTVRVGFQEMAEEFQKIHPDVRIVQEIIPSDVYGQWLGTQFISGKPLDIFEAGGNIPAPVMLAYSARYLVPLTKYVTAPNPYNKGTDLESVPWFKTYWDQMRMAYSFQLQEYMSIPLSQFCVRMAVNMDLLKKLTGLDEVPTDYQEFIKACEKIREQKTPQGRYYNAIAASGYNWQIWDGMMASYLTWPLAFINDFNYSGFSDPTKNYLGFRAGLYDLMDPTIVARFKISREVGEQFQTGFNGLARPEQVFGFIQQRSVFMACGSWEVSSLYEQSKGVFNMKIVDFPRITKNDPVYGRFAYGNPIEMASSSFNFSVARTCRNLDLAIEFLEFLGSKKYNEKFNKIIGWLPAIDGAEPADFLRPFKPHIEGMTSPGDFYLGAESLIKFTQMRDLYEIGQISYEDFAKQYSASYRSERTENDFLETIRNWRRSLINSDRLDSGLLIRALNSDPNDREIRMRQFAAQVTHDIGARINTLLMLNIFNHPKDYTNDILGEYSPEALATIHRRISSSSAPPVKSANAP